MILKRTIVFFTLLLLTVPFLVFGQATGVAAEAIQQANLRATTDINAPLVGQIIVGTRYPVIGRSEFYPWYLLGDVNTLAPLGWVFADLVTIFGDTNVVPYSTLVVGSTSPTITPTFSSSTSSVASTQTLTPAPTLNAAVIGTVVGEINIRFGPGVEYPRIGIGREGEHFEITGYHTQFPWVQIRYEQSPNGFGWVSNGLLEVQGDVFSTAAITQTRFDLPALTATPPVVQQSIFPGTTAVPLTSAFRVLGDEIWNMLLENGFETGTSRLGALYLMDLQTGEAITFGNQIAFSGMSINKIAILTSLFGVLNAPPDGNQAYTIAEAMICSENTSTNELLGIIGGGDQVIGAANVSSFMNQLGLQRSFLMAPFLINPESTPIPLRAPVTSADQTSAEPDPFNQMTVDEIGWLLSSVYQCAFSNSGPLMTNFPDAYTQSECQQILQVMSYNRIGEMLEAGVPVGTRVAHKHGWINDTHGDAGIVFTPGGDFVLVTVLHNPTWLNFEESFPLVATITRNVYNYYNPEQPMGDINPQTVPAECDLSGTTLIEDLMSPNFSLAGG